MLVGGAAELSKRYRDDQVVVLPRRGKVSRKTFLGTIQCLEAMA